MQCVHSGTIRFVPGHHLRLDVRREWVGNLFMYEPLMSVGAGYEGVQKRHRWLPLSLQAVPKAAAEHRAATDEL
jgi:hypothetical protein